MDDQERILQPVPVLAVLRSLPLDILRDSFWNVLPPESRIAFRQACRSLDAWVRHDLKTTTAVVFNHHYLESLGRTGQSLAKHFQGLQFLTIRQASAGRKPLPPEVVCTCLELLRHGSGPRTGDPHPAGLSFRFVRKLALRDWPSVTSSELALLADAFPTLEHLAVTCRTRSFPHHYDLPVDLLPALTTLFPCLSSLELRGLSLLQLLSSLPQPKQHHQGPLPSPPPPKQRLPVAACSAAAAEPGPESEADGACGRYRSFSCGGSGLAVHTSCTSGCGSTAATGPAVGTSQEGALAASHTPESYALQQQPQLAPVPRGPRQISSTATLAAAAPVNGDGRDHEDTFAVRRQMFTDAGTSTVKQGAAVAEAASTAAAGCSRGGCDRSEQCGGLQVLGRLTRLSSLALGTLDPPPQLLTDMGLALGRQLRVLELDVWLVMTPPSELRCVAVA
ncbi:hypothetical protein VOLCADRAFT_116694, partial [Volvox carteri f. nagariensis]